MKRLPKSPVKNIPQDNQDNPVQDGPHAPTQVPSFLYRIGQSITNGAASIKHGFERLIAFLFQHQSATAAASAHVGMEVGESAIVIHRIPLRRIA